VALCFPSVNAIALRDQPFGLPGITADQGVPPN